MIASFVIVTHNRRDALLATLARLTAAPQLPDGTSDFEIIVVDNGSADGAADAVAAAFPRAAVLRRPRNEGVSARNHGIAAAAGRYVVLLDDDSHPIDDAVARSVAYLDANPRVGALVGRVELPGGGCEASALPGVTINCAVVLRKAALDEVGLFPTEFFRQAEEYDLSFRLWGAGWRVERFEDLVYRHEKVAGNRAPASVHLMDLRNNLIVVERYLPGELRGVYRRDWTRRYTALARRAGHGWAARVALLDASLWRTREALWGRRTLGAEALESIFQFHGQAEAVAKWAKTFGVRRVAIADFSKNVYATWRACKLAGLEVAGLWDANTAFAGMSYRGLPIVAKPPDVEGVVLSNINPAQINARLARVKERFTGQVCTLWQPRYCPIPGISGAAVPRSPRAMKSPLNRVA